MRLAALSLRFAPLVVGVLGACAPLDAQPKDSAVRGVVTLTGTPAVRPLDRKAEPACENGEAFVETVLSWDGRLANVHVSVASGGTETKPPAQPVIVWQTDCIYVPRVQGVVRGQKVLVVNGDPTMHNVHAKAKGGTLTNKSQPARAAALELDTADVGDVLELGCDVHRWMRAYLPVTDNDLFDVTGPDGTFEITGVPRGAAITVRAWHEKYGVQTLEAKAGDELTFKFVELVAL